MSKRLLNVSTRTISMSERFIRGSPLYYQHCLSDSCSIFGVCPVFPSFSPFSGTRFIPVHLFLFCCGFRILVFSSAARSAVIIWPPVSSWRLCHVLFMARVSLRSFGVFGVFSEFLEFHLLHLICKRTEKHGKKECTCLKCTWLYLHCDSQAYCRSACALVIIP